ncbi:MAG: polyphosphate:AMP phosphotransferase [Phycisphaerales bacterium]
MFESAEIGHTISKEEFSAQEPVLRQELLAAQYELLRRSDTPVIVLVNGVDGAGKGETVNLFNEWMDPRHIHTHAFGPRTDEERARPEMWRFWRALPPKGRIGILFGSWYTDPILERVLEHVSRAEMDRRLEQIRHFERMLVAEGVVLVKLWFHLSKSAQRQRLKHLASSKRTAWRVTKEDWRHFKHYDQFVRVCEVALRETSTGDAPWMVIEGSDHPYRSLTAGRILLDAMQQRLAAGADTHRERAPQPDSAPPPPPALDGRNLLNALDYQAALPDPEYQDQLQQLQGKLARRMRGKRMAKRSLILVFEGMDAAGKGSTIRRVTRALDARHYRVIPVAAPTDEERAQPYLWRFWRHLPELGHCVIYDRSWYGRVLVERVEKLCSEADWMRAYHEINEFEEQLVDAGAVLCKFWLAVTPDEQLRRFKEREATPWKQFKITPEDWRNRDKWPAYEQAVCDMVDRTSTQHAPWHLIPSNDKNLARVTVLERICAAIGKDRT